MSDLVLRLRSHVLDRGGSSINGAWTMMLEAAKEIERLTFELELRTTERDYHRNVADMLAEMMQRQDSEKPRGCDPCGYPECGCQSSPEPQAARSDGKTIGQFYGDPREGDS